uniref:Uncharacterized protein n=1 Tax=Astyanax mexicanus TaxID=7994 RepID=A0A8B9RB19_ASTMX
SKFNTVFIFYLFVFIFTGRSGNLQPRPPTERASSERTRSRRSPQIYSAGRESSVTRNNAGVPYPSQEIEESSQRVFQQLVQPVIEQDPSVDRCTPDQAWSSETPGPNPRPLRCQSPSAPLPRLCVLQNGINEASDTEPQLTVGETEDQDEEELFTFSSQPHSAKRGQHFCDPFLDLTSDFKGESLQGEGERKEARLEDDFIGSEDEEYERCSPIQRFAALSSPAPTTPPCAALQKSTSLSRLFTEAVQVQASGAAPVCVAPTRCLSPSTPRQRSRLEWSGAERSKPDGETRTSISRTSVREIPLGDLRLHKVSTYSKRKSLFLI